MKNFLFVLTLLSVSSTLRANDPANENRTLSFTDAGRLAVSSSEELKNEYRRHYLREGAWAWGLRSYFPQITMSISEDDRLSQIGSDSFTKNYSIGAEQLLWDGGRLSLYRKLEKAEMDLELSSLGLMTRELAENAVSVYRQLLFYRKLHDIRKNALESLEEQRLVLQQEFELGLALPIDITGADITVTGARIELKSIRLDLDEAEKRFTEILGLEELPLLLEELDTERSFNDKPPDLVNLDAARGLAETRNLELKAARLSLIRRQAEARAASLSWIPAIKLTGNFGLSGQRYPLTKYNWSAGIAIEFSSPWISGKINSLAGWEPPYEKSARANTSINPMQNPADAYSAKNARLVMEMEKANYDLAFKRIGRLAEQSVEKCSLLEQKRLLALETLKLEGEKFHLAEIMLGLGRLTRVQLMEARLEYASREVAALEAATALLEAEHELEKILNLNPGELSILRSSK
ncbi:MAG: TolC family protein [Treponema sp.]|jgi:outer membrane protein TolC|nr:TolC family protein [Treponema sp.]